MLDVLVPEIRLQRPRIAPLISQRKAAGMPQHTRMCLEAFCACPIVHANKPGDAEGGAAFRRDHEKPGLARGKRRVAKMISYRCMRRRRSNAGIREVVPNAC